MASLGVANPLCATFKTPPVTPFAASTHESVAPVAVIASTSASSVNESTSSTGLGGFAAVVNDAEIGCEVMTGNLPLTVVSARFNSEQNSELSAVTRTVYCVCGTSPDTSTSIGSVGSLK